MELKPALTYEEQINRLRSVHILEIEDASSAIEIIKRVNYYRLSGYGIGLKDKKDPEKYVSGITIESLYRLYCFDSCFKNMLVHIIEQIEIQLRAQISNHLALKYGPEGYIDPSCFSSKRPKMALKFTQTFLNAFDRNANGRKMFHL